MQARHFLPCLALIATAAVALVVAGVSAASLVTLALVLACPLMMVVMMRSMDCHGDSDDASTNRSS